MYAIRSYYEYIQYYNIVFPSNDMFTSHYTLMPNACGTLSLAYDGNNVIAELWGASLSPIVLGVEPNGYRVLLLIQLSPFGLYQITRQSQAEFAGKRLSLEDIDSELFHSLYQAFVVITSYSIHYTKLYDAYHLKILTANFFIHYTKHLYCLKLLQI